jgi:hypothetical protein
LSHSEILVTLAEVSAAFVGFSIVAGLLRPTSSDAQLRFYAIRDVAEIGLVVVGGSLAPLALQLFSVSDTLLWRLCSFILSIAWLSSLSFALARFRKVGALTSPGRNPVWGLFALVLIGTGQILLWWNVVSPIGATSARYVTALLILLGLAAILFINAVFYVRDDEPAA